jgi:integrase
MAARKLNRTRYPGIYEVEGGKHRRYMVSYRLRGYGQRTKTHPTLREARDFQAQIRDPARARRLLQLEHGRISLAEYFAQWVDRNRGLAPSTRLRYEGVGRNYICSGPLGQMPISSIARDDVEEWITELVERGVGKPTIEKSYRTLRACLGTAELDGKVLSNPARRVSVPDSDGREPFFLSAAQVEAVANEVPDRDRALVYFLAYTGCRMGEATALRIPNLDLPRQKVRIVESSAEVGGRKLPASKTKTKRVRAIQMSDELAGELAGHLEQFGPRRGDSLDLDGLVFIGERGAAIRQGNWRARVFQPACQRAGITRRNHDAELELPTVQDLRHTAASLASLAGYSIHEVKEMLGHSTIKTTSDRYNHLFEDTKRERASDLGDLMRAARRSGDEVIHLAAAKS